MIRETLILAQVKEFNKINKVISMLSIFGLALLLILSPCKVRNFIQLELGVPQTAVGNKSKTTVSNSNCSSFEIATNTLTNNNSQPQQSHLITFNSDLVVTRFVTQSSLSLKARNHLASSIPLYILYQNFKDYL